MTAVSSTKATWKEWISLIGYTDSVLASNMLDKRNSLRKVIDEISTVYEVEIQNHYTGPLRDGTQLGPERQFVYDELLNWKNSYEGLAGL